MNKTFHSIWNISKQAWVAAAETVSAKGKPSSGAKVAAVMAGLMGGLFGSLLGSMVHAQTAPPPSALPTGGQVSAGQASIGQAGANMLIQQASNRAAINWQTFNVGSNAQVQFQQPDASSVTLNRVLSSDPSQIFGRITANGQVVLSNPAGVYFAPGARVDVGGLVATTHSIGDADFMAGSNRYERLGSTASVVNEGELKAALGSYIALLAPEVRNQGAVIAQMGTVALASGEVVELRFDSSKHLTSIRVEPSQMAALVDNRHAVQAPGGLVILSAQSLDRLVGGVVSNSGAIEATGLQSEGGRIVLSASSKVSNSGTLDVSSSTAQGGSVSLQGDTIELQNGSIIDASGATGGGSVRVGGNWQGSADPLLQATGQPSQAATSVTMASGASIDASATQLGQGGTVVLWSDVGKANSVTSAQGSVQAKGGAQGGNGGQVETSGHSVDTRGLSVNAGAERGASGLWLIDPYDYVISNASSINTSLNNGTSVTIDTANASSGSYAGSSGSGNITVSDNIGKSGGAAATLTLNAANAISGTGQISNSSSNALGVVFNAGGGTGIYSGLISGNVSVTKSGAGNLSLMNANTYTGGTTLSAGTLGVYTNTAMGTGALTVSGNSNLLLGRGVTSIANNLTLNATLSVSYDTNVDYLMVGGGGGGGSRAGGGGGAGGFVSGSTTVGSGSYSVSVGAGGLGQNYATSTASTNGGNSALGFVSTTAYGGGAGGGQLSTGYTTATNGGSGGGSQHYSFAAGTGIAGQGNAGGTGAYTDVYEQSWAGGGGGGAAGVGSVGWSTFSNGNSGNGGAGLSSTITGATVYYAGGGGGGLNQHSGGTLGLGGIGGGGNGSKDAAAANGVANTGGGGGGGGFSNWLAQSYAGGSGGSGVVIARYLGASAGTGGTVSAGTGTAAGYTLHSFTSTGSSTLALNALTTTFSGNISGSGGMTFNGGSGSQFTLTGTNTNTGTTTVNSGTLQVGSGGTSGTLSAGAVVNNAALVFNRSNALAVTGVISGSGTLTQSGSGTSTLTGNNTYTGATTISAGTLQVGDGGTSGSISASSAITDNSALVFNRSDDVTAGNTIGGSGTLTKSGSGALTLTTNPAYSGVTTISAGTLVLQNNAPNPSNKTFNGSGVLHIEPTSTSFGSAFSTSGWTLASTLSGLTLGKSGNTADITIANATSIAGPIAIYGGNIAINAGLVASGPGSTARITLQGTGSGTVTDGTNGYVQAGTSGDGSLLLLGGNVTLDNSASNDVDTLAASGMGSLTYIDKAGLNIGTVDSTSGVSASGVVSIGTQTGSLLVAQNVATTNTSATALTLNASIGSAVGADTAYNIQLSGSPTISVGSGGTARLLTGSVAGSTGLTALVGSGSGRFRYNADETTNLSSGSWTALGTGLNAIYREQTTANISGMTLSMSYGDALPGITATGLVNADAASYTIGSRVNSASGNIRASATPYAITQNLAGLGYNVTGTTSGTLSVNAKALTMSGLSVSPSKTYDGTTGATVNGTATLLSAETAGSGSSADGKPYTGDTVAITGTVVGTYNSKDVATANTVTYSGLSLNNTDYSLTMPSPASATISTKALSMSGLSVPVSKTYDGTTNAAISGTAALLPSETVGTGTTTDGKPYTSDTVAITGTVLGTYNSKDVSTANTVTYSGLALSNDNYSLTIQAPASATITTKALTISGLGSANKTYDGTQAASVSGSAALQTFETAGSGTSTDGKAYTGDAISVTGTATGSFNTKDVASANTVSFSGLSLTGSDVGNYTLTPHANAAQRINPKALTISGLGSANKTYDGTQVASVSGSAVLQTFETAGSGTSTDGKAYTGDAVSVTGTATGSFNTKDVASANTVSFSGLSLTGGDVGNYTLTPHATVTQRISPKALSMSGLTVASSKTYDGTTAAVVSGTAALQSSEPAGSGTTTDGKPYTGDTVAITGTAVGTYDSKDVATASTVTYSGLALSNDNYSLTVQSPAAATVTAKALTISGLSSQNKVYDGTTGANVNGTAALQTAIAAGSGTGSDGKAYIGDTVALTGTAVGTFNSQDVATANRVAFTGLSLAGADAGNYALSAHANDSSARITQAHLTVTANDDAKFLTQSDRAGFNGVSMTGFVHGETASVLGGAVSIARSNAVTNVAGVYDGALQASGLTSGNYQFSYVPGRFTIVPSNQLLLEVANASTAYGSASQYTISSVKYEDHGTIYTLGTGGVVGSSVSINASNQVAINDGAGGAANFALAPKSAVFSTASKLAVGSYQLGTSGTVTENSVNFSDTITVVGAQQVNTRGITASATGVSKVYDGSTGMTAVTLNLSNLETLDGVTVSGSGAFASKNVSSGLNYTIANLQLSGTDAGNYHLTGGTSFSGSNGTITARPLTVSYAASNKTYDGSTTVTVVASDNRVSGDVLSISQSAAFADKNVGTGKTVGMTGIALSGADAGNYTVANPNQAAQTTADITRLSSVSWVGGASGNWFDPANWAGGAVPDLSNVAHVLIPQGVNVSFGSAVVAPAQSGPVNIDSLRGADGSLTQSAGTLNVGLGGVTLNSYSQSGGSLNSLGPILLASLAQTGGGLGTGDNLTVTQDFSQGSLGSITVGGDTRITDTLGGLSIGHLSTTGSTQITSTGGDITQSAGTAVVSGGVTTLAASHHGAAANIVLNGAGNDFQAVVNATGADVSLTDANALTLSTVNASGNLSLTSNGALDMGTTTVGGNLSANSGNGNITQSGALTVAGTTGLDAGTGDIALMNSGNDFVGAVSASGDVIQINDRNALTLGTVHAAGDLSLTSNGALDMGATTVGGNLSANSGNGNITQSGALTVAGTTGLDAGTGDITLMNSGNDFVGAVSASGNVVQINDRNALTLGTVNTTGELSVNNTGALNLGTSTVGGDLAVNSGNGDITQTGALRVMGLAALDAGSGTVLLPRADNQLRGGVQIRAASATVVGDARTAASDAASRVQSSQTVASTAGTWLSSANAPAPLALASASPGSAGSGTSAPAAANGNSAGVTVDLHNSAQQSAPLMVAVSLPKATSTMGTGFSFEMPEAVKSMATPNTAMGITQSNGAPLPAWLKFDPTAMRFEATAVPDSALPMQLLVNVGGQRVQVVISERME